MEKNEVFRDEQIRTLSPLSSKIIDRTLDNVNRKLIGGYRNRSSSTKKPPTVSAQNTLEVSNRGVAWNEIVTKSLSHGISSISTIQFDGEFTVIGGKATGLENVPDKPGVYVVYDKVGEAVYIGDSTQLKRRWKNGHLQSNSSDSAGKSYKLYKEFEEGCTVRFVNMDSEATAAAVEAHLISEVKPRVNKREELKNEQSKRSNIDAQNIKKHMTDTKSIVKGASKDALRNTGWVAFEQLSAELLKALKDELIDVFSGGEAKLKLRIKRLCKRVWSVIENIVKAPMQLLKGIFEFIVNALSKAIRQVYMLARNIFDLGYSTWQLFKGAKSMSREELVEKVTETIVISGSLVVWDAIDPLIEAQLIPFLGPVAPFLSSTIVAVGFGLTSHYLQSFVPKIVEFLLNLKTGIHEALDAQRNACEQLIKVSEREMLLVTGLEEYLTSSNELIVDMEAKTQILGKHRSIEPFDIEKLIRGR